MGATQGTCVGVCPVMCPMEEEASVKEESGCSIVIRKTSLVESETKV